MTYPSPDQWHCSVEPHGTRWSWEGGRSSSPLHLQQLTPKLGHCWWRQQAVGPPPYPVLPWSLGEKADISEEVVALPHSAYASKWCSPLLLKRVALLEDMISSWGWLTPLLQPLSAHFALKLMPPISKEAGSLLRDVVVVWVKRSTPSKTSAFTPSRFSCLPPSWSYLGWSWQLPKKLPALPQTFWISSHHCNYFQAARWGAATGVCDPEQGNPQWHYFPVVYSG